MEKIIVPISGIFLIAVSLIEFSERIPQIVYSLVILCCAIFGAIAVAFCQKHEQCVLLRMIDALLYAVAMAFSVNSIAHAG